MAALIYDRTETQYIARKTHSNAFTLHLVSELSRGHRPITKDWIRISTTKSTIFDIIVKHHNIALIRTILTLLLMNILCSEVKILRR
jgi:hypothetical protein